MTMTDLFAHRLRLPKVFATSLLLLTVAAPGAAEWPQWRGPEGLGVAADSGSLPESWDAASPNVKWRTAIPGEGISSPVVSGGRVFVTTAYEGSGDRRHQSLRRGATLALALLFAVGFVRRRRPAPVIRARDGSARWDARVVKVASWVFLLIAIAMAVQPEAFFPEGNPGRVWRLAGGIALIGLAAAGGWFERGSSGRLWGTALVLLGVFLMVYRMPPGALGPAPPEKWIPFVVPALGIALWYLFSFWRARRMAMRSASLEGSHPLLALALALVAALLFVPNNFFQGLQRAVVSLDLESGEVLWQRSVLRGPLEQKWENSTYATPTPTADGQQVFAYFGHGLASLDFEGRILWVQKFPGYAQHTRYGAGASPILTADSVIVVRESEANQAGPPSWIAAFEKRSGRPLWRVEPPEARDSYTTPMLLEAGGRTELLTASWEALVAYDAGSGRRLWSHGYPMTQMVASPARSGGLLALTGGASGEKSLVVVQVEGEGASDGAKTLWQTKRGVATISSPVLYDGRLFTLTTPGILTCYQAETGKILWKARLDGEFFASLVAGDGKIYATSTEGSTSVVAAGPEYELIAVNDLEERVFASPAVASGCLLIRTASSLFCIDGGARAASSDSEPAPIG